MLTKTRLKNKTALQIQVKKVNAAIIWLKRAISTKAIKPNLLALSCKKLMAIFQNTLGHSPHQMKIHLSLASDLNSKPISSHTPVL